MTNIPFHLSREGKVKVEILDMSGKSITTLMDNFLQAGEYNVEFYTSKIAPGTYFCMMNAGGKTDFRKIIVTK